MDWPHDHWCRWRARLEPAGANAARHASRARRIVQDDHRTRQGQIAGGYEPRRGDPGSIHGRVATIIVADEPFTQRAPTRSGLSVNQKTLEKPRTKAKAKTQRPPLWKVILLNDDYTPREFVVLVLKAVFRMNESHAYKVMMTAHQRGACVIAVYTRDVAETKAKEATEMGRDKGYPLYFTTEKEE